jgi:hypothetical protein
MSSSAHMDRSKKIPKSYRVLVVVVDYTLTSELGKMRWLVTGDKERILVLPYKP